MGVSALGVLLSKLRENRRLNLRELGTLSDVDHSYIYKLEAGDKSSPSEDTLDKLLRVLKPSAHDRQILDFVLTHPNVPPDLVAYSLSDESVTSDELAMAMGAAYRGTGRPDPKTLIERARVALEAIGNMNKA